SRPQRCWFFQERTSSSNDRDLRAPFRRCTAVTLKDDHIVSSSRGCQAAYNLIPAEVHRPASSQCKSEKRCDRSNDTAVHPLACLSGRAYYSAGQSIWHKAAGIARYFKISLNMQGMKSLLHGRITAAVSFAVFEIGCER